MRTKEEYQEALDKVINVVSKYMFECDYAENLDVYEYADYLSLMQELIDNYKES